MLRDSILATKGTRGRRVLLGGSLVLHAIFAVGLIVWSFVHVDEVAPPPLTLVWNSNSLPITVNLGGGGGGQKAKKSRPKDDKIKNTPRRTTELTQPRATPDKISDTDNTPIDTSTGDDGPGDDGGGDGTPCTGPNCDGTPCTGPNCGGAPCVGPDCGGGGAPPPAVEKPKNLAHDLTTESIYRVDPRLPDFVKNQQSAGTTRSVMAKMCIDRGGHVTSVTVLRGIDGADDVIRDVLRTWRYKPQPVPVCFPVNLEYTFE